MKKLIVLSFALLGSAVFAQQSAFEKANQAYSDGDYQKALSGYKTILNDGKVSSDLYYNAGNVHYKLGNIAESIFYYEKALQLAPSDAAVKNNLKFANKRTIDAIETRKETGLNKIVNGIIASFSVNSWAWIAIVFAFGTGVFFVLYSLVRRQIQQRLSFTLMAFSLVLCVLAVVFAYQQYGVQKSLKYAIVAKKETDVRNEPNPGASKTFELHEGTKVRVVESFNGYRKIELADGQIGWLKEKAVKSLDRAQF